LYKNTQLQKEGEDPVNKQQFIVTKRLMQVNRTMTQ